MAIKTCKTCGKDEVADASVRNWYVTPQPGGRTVIKALCLGDAAAIERRGATVLIVPTNRQRAVATRWARAGIGAN